MSFNDRIARLEAIAGLRNPRCAECGRMVPYMIGIVDAHTGEKIDHWLCVPCKRDAFTGRRVQQWEDGNEIIPGAMVISWPPGFVPSLPVNVPVPDAITHWIDI